MPSRPAVVAHVDPVAVPDALRHREELVGEVELGRRRLAAGEVELVSAFLEGLVGGLLLLQEGLDLLGGAVSQCAGLRGLLGHGIHVRRGP